MAAPRPPLSSAIQSSGGIRAVLARGPAGTGPAKVGESGLYRLRFTCNSRECEGVILNTGGGMVAGDCMSVAIELEEGAEAVLTSLAAEKIYRSNGAEVEVDVMLRLGPLSRLAWLPQEQILFDGARFRRLLQVDMAENATLTLVESTVFGRLAAGEVMQRGAFRDRWRLRRGGKLIFADDVRLEGAIDSVLQRPAAAGGGRAIGTVLHIAPGAESLCDGAREVLQDARSECGATVFDGMMVARFVSSDAQGLRTDLVRFIEWLRGRLMPRTWQT